MALGERFKGGGARGIARFLAEHQECDAGFDVRREDEPGSGKLRITCLGCGATVAYRAAEAGNFGSSIADVTAANGSSHALGSAAVGTVEPVEPAAAAKPAPSVPGKPVGEGPSTAPRSPSRSGSALRVGRGGSGPARLGGPGSPPPPAAPRAGSRLPGWAPTALIALLIAAGLAMIVAGLLRDDGEEPSTSTPAATQPAPAAEPATPPPATPPPAAGAEAGEPPSPAPELRRRAFAGRFAIGVPAGWDSGGSAAEGFSFEPQGSSAAVHVFFEDGDRPLGELADLAAIYLAEGHAGASIGAPERVRFAGGPAARVLSRYEGGEEVAYVLSRGGFSYLVLRRVDRGASPAIGAEADAASASFRPR